MDDLNKGGDPINAPAATASVAETVTLTKAELDEIKHKADVSSQNFERAKKAEEDLKALREQGLSAPSQEVWSDEGKLLAQRIEAMERENSQLKEARALEQVKAKYPILGEKMAEFEQFKLQYPSYASENIAKLFLVENGLLGVEPERKGLEKPTGGPRTSAPIGMTLEDVDNLRQTNFQLYKSKLLSGEIKV